jgi:hypothetical protein
MDRDSFARRRRATEMSRDRWWAKNEVMKHMWVARGLNKTVILWPRIFLFLGGLISLVVLGYLFFKK